MLKWIKKKLADFFRCKRGLNKTALKIKRGWDEVSTILNLACMIKKNTLKKKKKKSCCIKP